MLIYPGEHIDRIDLPLATRRGWPIPNMKRLERNPASLRAAVDFCEKLSTVHLRSATSVYNCMGLVFASRRTCIEPTHLRTILNHDEYRQLKEQSEIQIGDIVVYCDREQGSVTHVGVVTQMEPEIQKGSWNITIMSQWGGDGEYFHSINNVPPLLGEPAEYWTDRRLKP